VLEKGGVVEGSGFALFGALKNGTEEFVELGA
jgi:hypothetical protein